MKTLDPPAQLSFQDTELAFRHMSDHDLRRRYMLFRMIDSPVLTRLGPPFITFCLRMGLPVTGIIKRTIYDIFAGGTSIEGTEDRSQQLLDARVQTILDYSVEGKKDDPGFDATRDEIIATLRYGAEREAVAFSAMKVSGIAHFGYLAKNDTHDPLSDEERGSLERSRSRLDEICSAAYELGQPVFVDAEESWIQRGIDRWTEAMMEKYNQDRAIVYHTIQLYRHDRLAYLEELIGKAREKGYVLGVKLVRGAYIEKENDRAEEKGYPTPMQPDKPSTDRDFNAALRLCVDHIDNVAICAGTHNEASSMLLTQLMQEKGIPADHPHVIFAQLLGMSDNISFNLAHHGYNVAKYLPYGPVRDVLPYLFRRANENTSIAGQSSREVQFLRREVHRRQI